MILAVIVGFGFAADLNRDVQEGASRRVPLKQRPC
jgi:hypothetical protein